MEIDVLVLDRAPETLDEDIVMGSTSPIHTDANVGRNQNRCERLGRELAALVSVEYLWPGHGQRLLKGQSAEVAVQGVGKLPGQDVAAIPVDHCGQIHESSGHRHIGNICGPDLIGAYDFHLSQQIGIVSLLYVDFTIRGFRLFTIDSFTDHVSYCSAYDQVFRVNYSGY